MYDQLTSKVKNLDHIPGGANTLYVDGHVEFLKYPSEYPASRAIAEFWEQVG